MNEDDYYENKIDDISRMNVEQIKADAGKLVPLLLHEVPRVRRAALMALTKLDRDTLATYAEPAIQVVGPAHFPETMWDRATEVFEFLYLLSPAWLDFVHRLEIVKFLNGQDPWKTLATGLILRRPPVGLHVGDLMSILNAAINDFRNIPSTTLGQEAMTAECRAVVALEALDKLVNVHDTDARPVVDALLTFFHIPLEDVTFRVLKKMNWPGLLELSHLEVLYRYQEMFHKLVLETPPIALMRNYQAMTLLYANKDTELIAHADQALLPPSDNSPGGALYVETQKRFQENATRMLAYMRHGRGEGL
tara:strand:- start:535 stop:1455 length:921 start_codon:yes stop_codon:yes gene_type:complete